MWIKIKDDYINLDKVEMIQVREYKISLVRGNTIYGIMAGPKLTESEFQHIKMNLLEKLKDKTIVLLEGEKGNE